MNNNDINALKRQSVLARKHIIESIYSANSGHPGGSLSCTDILTVLYFNKMRLDPKNPNWTDRDRFVLSKGHCAPALYSILALRGFFDVKELITLRKIDSFLEGHPNMKTVPGVDMSTGSLGQGISTAVGMALAGKLDKKDHFVYSIIGDGEIEEGQVWEALMSASHYKLNNLIVFLDHNGLQIDGKICEVMSPEPVYEKFYAFGWNVLKVDGHDILEIINAVDMAKKSSEKPTMIIAETVKGKGVSFMENQAKWHGSPPNTEEKELAIKELDQILLQLKENSND